MTKSEKVTFVINTLNELYPEIPIPLDHKDPYTLLIAVLLSAQCTDVRVNQITPILFAKADNPYDMVKMSIEEIKEIIRPCGLSPMKSKGIHCKYAPSVRYSVLPEEGQNGCIVDQQSAWTQKSRVSVQECLSRRHSRLVAVLWPSLFP